MTQNAILKGTDNSVKVEFKFTGDFAEQGLRTFSELEFKIGNETYSTIDNPELLYIEDKEGKQYLVLSIGMQTLLDKGHYLPEIIGYSPVYDDGYTLTGRCKPYLKYLYVMDC